MKTNKRNTIFVLLATLGFVAIIILLIVFTVNGYFADHALIEAILIGVLVLLAALLAIALFFFFNQYAVLKTLQIENAYVLGKKSDFNNI